MPRCMLGLSLFLTPLQSSTLGWVYFITKKNRISIFDEQIDLHHDPIAGRKRGEKRRTNRKYIDRRTIVSLGDEGGKAEKDRYSIPPLPGHIHSSVHSTLCKLSIKHLPIDLSTCHPISILPPWRRNKTKHNNQDQKRREKKFI